ncbi:MAG: hypothetical protein ACP6IQ_02365 [Candidatus Njordarchaeia archaeon]
MIVKENEDGSVSGYVSLATGTVFNRIEEDFGYSSAMLINRDDFTSTTWDNNPNIWGTGIPAKPKEKIKKAVQYYSVDPLVNKSVKLSAQLANDSFKITAENKQIEDFFSVWWKKIGGSQFLSYFFLEYFRSGNVPIFKMLVPYTLSNTQKAKSKKEYGKFIKASEESKKIYKLYEEQLDEYIKAISLHEQGEISKEEYNKIVADFNGTLSLWKEKAIPGGYTILNPLAIDIKGPEDLPWLRLTYLSIDDELKKFIQNPPKEVNSIIKFLPKEIILQIKQGASEVYLPDYLCSIVTRDKQPYEVWAEPLCTHAFEALDFKKELREMDRHTVRGVRNRILKVTIGNDQFPVFDKNEIKQVAQMFNNPSRNLTIVWNHTLQIEYIEPNLDSLNMEKYEPVNDEIRTCFGISEILTGGKGSAIGNNVLNLKGLVEILSEAQDSFITWFNKELERICKVVGFDEVPQVSFNKLNLKDENDYMRVLAYLVERQIISHETAVETLGFHFGKEVDRLKKEEQLREKFNILRSNKSNSGGLSPGDAGGRPVGVPEPEGREETKDKPKKPAGIKTVSQLMNEISFIKEYLGSATSKRKIKKFARLDNVDFINSVIGVVDELKKKYDVEIDSDTLFSELLSNASEFSGEQLIQKTAEILGNFLIK